MKPSRIANHGTLAALAVLVLWATSAEAALFRLRAQCQSRGPVVTLGDVAEVVTSDPQESATLGAIELFPAPSAEGRRFVRVREIQDLLLLRGVNLAEHEFTGASQVAVSGMIQLNETQNERPLGLAAAQSAGRRVGDAAVEHLRAFASADLPWVVEVELDASQARLVADRGRAISIGGGTAPWIGPQRFEVSVATPEGPVRFAVDARVSTAPSVVVAARALPSGMVLQAADLKLLPAASEASLAGAFLALDQVLGKETTRAIPEGKLLEQNLVRSPQLVRRGDAVTVYVRSPGICVRTVGRARENGGLGELVAVESLEDRSTFFATVSNVREVEVYARPPKADATPLDGLSPVASR